MYGFKDLSFNGGLSNNRIFHVTYLLMLRCTSTYHAYALK
jgi:hypothetical protein